MSENIAFKITVDTDVADLSVGELKQAFKDLTTEINTTQVGTDKYKQTLTKLGDVKGALKDVKEQINALDPEKKFRAIAQVGSSIASGFAAAQGAVALFGSESEDLQKVLVRVQAATALASGLQGLQGMGKAFQTLTVVMKANPIWTLAAVLTGIGAALFALRDKIPLVGAAFEKIGGIINSVISSIKKFTDAIGISDFAKEELQKVKDEHLKHQMWENSMRDAMRAANKLEREKKEEEEKKQREKDKIKRELWAKEDAKRKAELAKEDQDFYQRYILDVVGQNFRNEVEQAEIAKNEKQALKDEELDFFNRYILQVHDSNKKNAEEDIELARMVKDAKLSLAIQTFGVIGDLANAFAGENEKGQKRAFEINKAASIAEAIVSTYAGANKMLSATAFQAALFPAQPFINAGLVIAAGLANVAKIAQTKFEAKGAGSGGGGAATGSVNAPNLQSPQTANNNAVTISQRGVNEDQQGNFAGFQQPIKAYVVETEMTSAQKTIQSIEQRTTF